MHTVINSVTTTTRVNITGVHACTDIMGTGSSVRRSTRSVLNEVERLKERVVDIQVSAEAQVSYYLIMSFGTINL